MPHKMAAAPWGSPCWGSLGLKDRSLREGPVPGQFVEDCLPWEGPHGGAGAERGVLLPLRRKERQRQGVTG